MYSNTAKPLLQSPVHTLLRGFPELGTGSGVSWHFRAEKWFGIMILPLTTTMAVMLFALQDPDVRRLQRYLKHCGP